MSLSFDRPRGEAPDAEHEMAFEEVDDEGAEDLTYKDPVEEMTKTILELEQEVAALQKAATTGRADKRALEVARVRLAEVRYKRQAHHESQGRSQPDEADRLLDEWDAAKERLKALTNASMDQARAKALSRFDDTDPNMDPDTIRQLRHHRRAA